ncbi:hypothetical protein D3C85_674020 [compost metagenome]
MPRLDGDALADDVEIRRGKNIAAAYRHVIAGNHRQRTACGADRAARFAALQGGVALLVHRRGLAAIAEADAAAAHETALLGAGMMQLVHGIGGRIDRDVITRK